MVQSLPVKTLFRRIFPWVRRLLQLVVIIGAAMLILSASSMPPPDQTERVRYYTRDIEFDYVNWMVNALRVKAFEGALETDAYLSDETRHQMIIEYMNLVSQIDQ